MLSRRRAATLAAPRRRRSGQLGDPWGLVNECGSDMWGTKYLAIYDADGGFLECKDAKSCPVGTHPYASGGDICIQDGAPEGGSLCPPGSYEVDGECVSETLPTDNGYPTPDAPPAGADSPTASSLWGQPCGSENPPGYFSGYYDWDGTCRSCSPNYYDPSQGLCVGLLPPIAGTDERPPPVKVTQPASNPPPQSPPLRAPPGPLDKAITYAKAHPGKTVLAAVAVVLVGRKLYKGKKRRRR